MASESDSPQPVAWVAFADDGSESAVAVMHRDEAEEIAARHGWQIAPLYRSPVCPYVTGTVTRYCTLTPFTLTDAEREAIEWAMQEAGGVSLRAATLRGLLERTRP